MKNKKRKQNIIFVSVVFMLALIGIFGYHIYEITKREDGHARAEVSMTEVENASSKEIITVHSCFYNYRSDNEISSNKRDQGSQGLYSIEAVPFAKFNQKLNDYYKQKGISSGIYIGNFYNYYQDLLAKGQKAIAWPNYYNFYWAPNIANRTAYNSVCQGIVSSSLGGFNNSDITSGTLNANGTSEAIPFFNKEFLGWKDNDKVIGKYAENVGFPFRKTSSSSKGDYYEFNSSKDVIQFKEMSTDNAEHTSDYFGSEKLEYYYQDKQVYILESDRKKSSTAQFLPFNKGDNIHISDSKSFSENKTEMNKIDYGFGFRLNIPFRLTEDGKLNGKDMVFTFSGDDDVWIFVDGKLVLDLGGQHAEATGSIDFSGNNTTATTTVNHVTYERNSGDANHTAVSNAILGTDTYSNKITSSFTITKKDEDHVMTVFFMERGMYSSNFKMTFNFLALDDPEFATTPTPVPTPTSVPTPSSSVSPTPNTNSLTIQNVVSVPAINECFKASVWTSVEKDIFDYSLENKGTTLAQVGNSELKKPSGKLTVRQRPEIEGTAFQKKFLSFGDKPVVRIYFDLQSANDKAVNFNSGDENYRDDTNKYIVNWTAGPYVYINNKYEKMTQYLTTNYYYYDFSVGDKFKFSNNSKSGDGWNWGPVNSNDITVDARSNGILYAVSGIPSSRTTEFNCTNEPVASSHPAQNSGIVYSQNFPYQTPGAIANYNPSDSHSSEYQKVANTNYQITEAYPAPTDSNILVNDAKGTVWKTDENGTVALLSDDAATFKNQFISGSSIRIRCKENLEKSYSVSKSVTPNPAATPDKYITQPTSLPVDQKRMLDQFYKTKQEVTSKETIDGNIVENSVKLSASGTFSFKKINSESTSAIDITETFTHTVKTGKLMIYKNLQGLLEDDKNQTNWEARYDYPYKFIISFENVFGISSASTFYNGKADLYTRANKDSKYVFDKKIDISDGVVNLTGNQYVVISGIPVGTNYSITETDSSSSDGGSVVGTISVQYKANVEGDIFTSENYKSTNVEYGITEIDKGNRKITGKIPGEIIDANTEFSSYDFSDVEVKVEFTNQWGAITLKKEVGGQRSYAKNKKYSFFIQKEGTGDTFVPYTGEGIVKTPKNTINSDGESITTYVNEIYDFSVKSGIIELEANQTLILGNLSLTENKQYLITEIIPENAIYECIQVNEGGIKLEASTKIVENKCAKIADAGNHKIQYIIKTSKLNAANPSINYAFINWFYEPYICIEKYFNENFYNDEMYSAGITYKGLTNADQTFIFKVQAYEDASCNKKIGEPFHIVLQASEALSDKVKVEGQQYYKISKKCKMNMDYYYKITEDISWSWKYTLTKVEHWGCFEATSDPDSKYVIVKGTRADDTNVPDTARFYNNKKTIAFDGDTSDRVNKIYKNKAD